MRSSCSQEQQKKDLSVYDFNADDLAVEEASAKYRTRPSGFFPLSKSKSNPKEEKEASLKYTFLQAFTSGLNCKQMDVNDVSYIELHENGSPRGSFGIDSPERNLATTDERSELGENVTSSASYEERRNVCLSEFDPEALVRVEPLMRGATGLGVPLVGNEQDSNLQSDGTSVDVVSDDEESCRSGSKSPSSSASDHVEDEDYMENSLRENCFTAFGQKDKDDLAVIVSPDFVIYENTLFGDAKLFFSSDSILVKCSDVNGGNESFVLEWAIADIMHVERQWSGSVEAALVKFHLKATTVNGNRKIQDTCDAVELIFAVSDMRWREKELKIKCLAERYNDIWNVSNYDCSSLEDDSVEHNMFFPRHYFTEIPDSFEDVIYPKGDPDAVSISRREIELLQPDTFINDTIIDFYIKYLKTNKILPTERHRFHFFNSFFFRKLADLDMDPGSASEGRAAFLRVRKWTRKVNIFEMDYIFIPVNFNLHWSLLVICHPGEVSVLKEDDLKDSPKVPCILHMDSIKGSHSGLKNLIQSYLLEEWKERHPESTEDYTSKFSTLRFVPLEVPQQENSFDCGLFLLHFVELFLEEAPVNFSPFRISKFSSFLTGDWFIPSEASFKRSLIRKLIYDLLNDPSQNVTPTTCSNGHLYSGYHDNNIEQKPSVEFLNKHCGPSKAVLDNSTCSLTVKGIEMNLETLASPGIAHCDKLETSVMYEFLEPGTNSMSLFQEDAPIQMSKCASCPAKELADKSKQLITSNLDGEDGQPVGESSITQTCSTSYCLDHVGEFGTLRSSMQEKEEIGLDLFTKTSEHGLSNQSGEMAKEGSVSIEDCGYVPDSPTSSSGENPRSVSDDPEEINTTQEIEVATETKGEINTDEAKGDDNDYHQKIETTWDDGQKKDSLEIDTCKVEALVGDDLQVVDTAIKVDVGKDKDRQESDTCIVAECGGSHQESLSPLDASECGGSRQESLPPPNSKDIVINADENSLVDDAQVKRERPSRKIEVYYQKRRKVSQPDGERRRTRSFSRDCSTS